jgi:branched-chain amino acid transport system ATP-binding protein
MTCLRWADIVGLLGLTLTFCFVGNSYQVFLVALVGLTTMVGVGLNVLFGLSGQISLGQVGFYAIGAYTSAILTTTVGTSFWLALPLAVLLAGLIGTVLALPALRVTGPYLTMVTISQSTYPAWQNTACSSSVRSFWEPFGWLQEVWLAR